MLHKKMERPVVLVVEDEPLVRLDIALALVDAGFSVIEVPDADQALALMIERERIGMVFTDVELPGTLDGLELASRIKRDWPGVPVVVTSGRVRDTEGVADVFIPKPYLHEQVISQARTLAA